MLASLTAVHLLSKHSEDLGRYFIILGSSLEPFGATLFLSLIFLLTNGNVDSRPIDPEEKPILYEIYELNLPWWIHHWISNMQMVWTIAVYVFYVIWVNKG